MKLYHLALKRSSLEETFMSTALSFEAQAAPPGQQPGFAPQVGEQYPQQGQGVGDGC
jgi:hypothetical protein